MSTAASVGLSTVGWSEPSSIRLAQSKCRIRKKCVTRTREIPQEEEQRGEERDGTLLGTA
jgi:hypothetical protein